MAWTPDTATAGVFATLLLQGIIGVVVYFLFELSRGQMEIFWPKRRTRNHRCPKSDPSLTPFGWVRSVLTISDEETLHLVGTDGFVLLRYLRMCAKVCLCCGAFACILLVPVYATAYGDDEVVGISRLTMANITSGGDRLWAPFFCTWIFTIAMLYFLYQEYEFFVHLRHEFLIKGDPDLSTQHLYSVVAENIPQEHQTSEKLYALFENLFSGEVVSAQMGVRDTLIVKANQERAVFVAKLEQAVAQYEASDREDKPMVSLKAGKVVMCRGDEEVEAIPYYLQEVQRLNTRIAELKAQLKHCGAGTTASAERLVLAAATPGGALTNGTNGSYSAPASPVEPGTSDARNGSFVSEDIETPGKTNAFSHKEEAPPGSSDEETLTEADVSGTGFVTFRTKCTQMTASQVGTLSSDFPTLQALPATNPQDIIWANIPASLNYIRAASLVTKIALYTGVLFWAVILAFISAISSLSNLQKYLPFLADLDPVSYALLQGQLPVIALIVFISLLPLIFSSVATYIEKRKTVTEVNMEVFTWFFAYQIANVYLILLAGSMFEALADVISDPMSIVSLLAASLPGVSTFFLNLMITFLFAGVPLALLRLVPMVVYKLYRTCFNARKLTRRTLIEGPLADVTLDYSTELPQFLYIMCIALTYWVIAPILVFVTGLLFGANYLVYKYQLCYIVVNNNETGGLFFYKLFNYTMIGLMASTITMVGYMGLKEGAIQAPLLAPLILIVYAAWCYIEERFKALSMQLSYQQALVSDHTSPRQDALQGGHTSATKLKADFYQHPLLRGHTDVLPQAYRVHATATSYAAIAKGAAQTDEAEVGTEIPLLTPIGTLTEAYHQPTTVPLETLFQEFAKHYEPPEDIEHHRTGSPMFKKA